MSKITQRVPYYAMVSSGKLKTSIYNLGKVAVGHTWDLLLLAFYLLGKVQKLPI